MSVFVSNLTLIVSNILVVCVCSVGKFVYLPQGGAFVRGNFRPVDFFPTWSFCRNDDCSAADVNIIQHVSEALISNWTRRSDYDDDTIYYTQICSRLRCEIGAKICKILKSWRLCRIHTVALRMLLADKEHALNLRFHFFSTHTHSNMQQLGHAISVT